jgi:hypothetical protein
MTLGFDASVFMMNKVGPGHITYGVSFIHFNAVDVREHPERRIEKFTLPYINFGYRLRLNDQVALSLSSGIMLTDWPNDLQLDKLQFADVVNLDWWIPGRLTLHRSISDNLNLSANYNYYYHSDLHSFMIGVGYVFL